MPFHFSFVIIFLSVNKGLVPWTMMHGPWIKLSHLSFSYLSIVISITPISCMLSSFWVFNRCFKRLVPWCNRNDLLNVFICKLIVTTITTKIRIHVYVFWINLYLTSSQNLIALTASHSVKCVLSMATWTMASNM